LELSAPAREGKQQDMPDSGRVARRLCLLVESDCWGVRAFDPRPHRDKHCSKEATLSINKWWEIYGMPSSACT